MNGMLLLSGVVAFLLGLLSLKRSHGLARLLHTPAAHGDGQPAELPMVSVLAPCRGIDNGFEAYARALLCQEYPHYEVLFIVESTVDPAWHVLGRILAETPSARAALVVAGTAEGCSQKIHNLLVGLEYIDAQTTTLAFVDSDAQVHRQWLKALVAALEGQPVGATSGFRWYVPGRRSWASSLRSAWNAASIGLIVHPRFEFAWGGSCAIHREVFEKLHIGRAWSCGLSDDLLLTRAVRSAGLRIQFVPACLVPSFEPCTWRELLEWTNRQVTITRVYALHLWRVGLLVQLMNFAFGLLGVAAAVVGQWLASGWLLSYWVLSGIGSMVVCRAATHRLAVHGCTVRQRAWPQVLWAPAVTALSLVSLAVSLATRTIVWRGISYTMLSPQQVVVHRDASAPATSSRAP
jgi:cellulose synthase/poly-beta-1,6-N-acetylglucosamine synthase-like glycosyltransferase